MLCTAALFDFCVKAASTKLPRAASFFFLLNNEHWLAKPIGLMVVFKNLLGTKLIGLMVVFKANGLDPKLIWIYGIQDRALDMCLFLWDVWFG